MCIEIIFPTTENADLWPTVLGACIGAIGTIIGGFIGIYWQTCRIQREYDEKKCRIRSAIFIEMDELWKIYKNQIMKPLDGPEMRYRSIPCHHLRYYL